MALTLLQIVQEASAQLGLRQPSAVVGSTDLTAQILLRFAVQAGRELSRYHDWQNLIVQNTITATATTVQTSALPSDFARMAYNAEIWDRTSTLRYSGPTNQRVWQQLQSGVGQGVSRRWRLLGNQLNLYPAPTSGNTIAFETISKNWCESSTGTSQEIWMADTDTPLLPDHLFPLEIVWRFRASRGFPMYAEDMKTCEIEKEKAASADRGTGRIRPGGAGNMPPDPVFTGTIDG